MIIATLEDAENDRQRSVYNFSMCLRGITKEVIKKRYPEAEAEAERKKERERNREREREIERERETKRERRRGTKTERGRDWEARKDERKIKFQKKKKIVDNLTGKEENFVQYNFKTSKSYL